MSDWATEQERQRHIEALYWVGEWVIFFLMWTEIDFADNLVARCQRCYSDTGGVGERIAAVYDQPTINKCPDCYGTTFEGGFRARIIRPAIFADVDETERPASRGTMHPATTSVESTTDFRMREGDFIIRADNTRWRASTPQRVMLRTGFGHPSQYDSSITYNNAPAKLEDKTSVAYLLPAPNVGAMLSVRSNVPMDFSNYEILHGPLLPDGFIA